MDGLGQYHWVDLQWTDWGNIIARVELRIWFKQGEEKRLPTRKKRLPARILTKARKRLLRQNATRLCVNLWGNAQYKSA